LESQTIDVLFSKMQKNNIHITIALDEFGGTEGLITIEEIVGNISSESNELGFSKKQIKEISPNQYIGGNISSLGT